MRIAKTDETGSLKEVIKTGSLTLGTLMVKNQIERTNEKAIYKISLNNIDCGFEIIKIKQVHPAIRNDKGVVIGNDQSKTVEAYPSDEEFGRIAIAVHSTDLNVAMIKYNNFN